jgi:hypothetical protein
MTCNADRDNPVVPYKPLEVSRAAPREPKHELFRQAVPLDVSRVDVDQLRDFERLRQETRQNLIAAVRGTDDEDACSCLPSWLRWMRACRNLRADCLEAGDRYDLCTAASGASFECPYVRCDFLLVKGVTFQFGFEVTNVILYPSQFIT